MNWELTKTLNGSDYWTLVGHNEKAVLRFNELANSIRLISENQRLYFMERKGGLHSKILLKTEYSVIIGESFFGRNRLSGIVNLPHHKYSFEFKGDELTLKNRNKETAAGLNIPGVKYLGLFEFSALMFGTALLASRAVNLTQMATTLVA